MQTERINLLTLAVLLQRMVEDYKQRGLHDVDLAEHDAYLALPTDEMFAVYEEPGQPLPVGSLEDDLEGLVELMRSDARPATAVDFERMGNLLRAVSHAMSR